jgi:hemoglobin-like flavoprotein
MSMPMLPFDPQEVSMTTDQVTLVKTSFASIGPAADVVASRFYARLFELDPALRVLFQSDMAEQRHKLMQMLSAIVDALDRPALIVAELTALGQRHASYGVIAEHYPIVEEALLWALAQELGERWTAEVEAAWRAAYTLVAGTMEAAASGVNLAPPGATDLPTDQGAGHQSPHRVSDPP